jgi:alkanesulfonate monooxygenase SsuD/methylene tetrahydromethanopterin reductase-like flavin-dependent oxidoreductase (luciferase family)
MRTGLILSGGGTTVRQMVDLACRAEAAGLDSVYVTEAWRSGFVPLTAIAMATSRVEIGPYILNAYGRSPWLTAMSAVDLDELSGGRLVLGLGTGNKHINEDWQGIEQRQPVAKMAEYVPLLKAALAVRPGETLTWQGRIHSMNWSPSVTPHRPGVPVYLAALYPRMTEVAAREADGIALGALLSAEYLRERVLPRFEAAAVAAGRDPGVLGKTLAPFVSVGPDAQAARDAARQAICRLYAPLPHPYYDYVLREQGFAKAADAALRWVPEGQLERAMEAISDEMLDTVTVAGTPEQCRESLARFEGVVDQVLFVNVNYSAESEAALMEAFDNLIELGRDRTAATDN